MKAVIYARQSSGDEEVSASVEMQLEKCRELAAKENLEIVGEFSDLNTSGRTYPTGAEAVAALDATYERWYKQQTKTKKFRNGLGKALAKIQSDKCALVIYDITRLYRPVTGSFLESYISQKLGGTEIHSTKGKIDLAAFGDGLIASITNRINDDQLKLQKEKSKLEIAKLRDAGRYYGTAILGYKYDKNTKRYVGIERELEGVRLAYKLCLEKLPMAEICRRLDAFREGRAKINDFGLRRLLRHPEYCGLYRKPGGELIPLQEGLFDVYPVPKSEWYRVQVILGDAGAKAPRPKKYEYALNGLVRCGYCGKAMTMSLSPNRQNNGMTTAYRCMNGIGRHAECRFAKIKYSIRDPQKIGAASPLETYSYDSFAGRGQRVLSMMPAEAPEKNAVMGILEAIMPLLASVCITTINDADRPEKIAERIAVLKSEAERAKIAKRRIVRLIADGLLTDDDAGIQLNELNQGIAHAENELAVLENENKNAGKQAVQNCFARLEQIQRKNLSPTDFRELFRRRFEKIEVFDTYIVLHLLTGQTIKLQKNIARASTGMPQFNLEVKKYRDGKIKAFVTYYYNSAFVTRQKNDDEIMIYDDAELRIVTIGHCESHSHHATSAARTEWKKRLHDGHLKK